MPQACDFRASVPIEVINANWSGPDRLIASLTLLPERPAMDIEGGHVTGLQSTLVLFDIASLGTAKDNEVANAISTDITYADVSAKYMIPAACQKPVWNVDLSMQGDFPVYSFPFYCKRERCQYRQDLYACDPHAHVLTNWVISSRSNHNK